MTINLAKGGKVDLTKEAGGTLTNIRVALGWDVSDIKGDADADASIIGLTAAGVCAGEEWFVFYNRLTSPDNVIVHSGDERTGAAEGDDESITIDLDRVPSHITELVVAVTLHQAIERGQTFGMVKNAFVRVVNEANGTELARYSLSADAKDSNSVVYGKAYREDGAWKFVVIEALYTNELQGIIDEYKVA